MNPHSAFHIPHSPGPAGLLDREIAATPVAVVDFETTGMYAGEDRVVEVAVVRVEPGGRPEVVFDTLVHPRRRVGATWVHGIRDEDVAGAPYFEDIADPFLEAIGGCVVAAYNVYFDIKFLEYELSRAGRPCRAPHLCLMYLRPMLGLGERCSLGEACRCHRIPLVNAHRAADDALASACLWEHYVKACAARGVRTYRDLAKLKKYKFAESWGREPLAGPGLIRGAAAVSLLKPRG